MDLAGALEGRPSQAAQAGLRRIALGSVGRGSEAQRWRVRAGQVLPGAGDADEGGAGDADVGAMGSPAAVVRGGALSVWCRWLWAWRRRLPVGDFGDGGAGGCFVDDGFAGGVGGDEGLEGEVVDGAGVAAGGGVDERGGVVAEQGVGAAPLTELPA